MSLSYETALKLKNTGFPQGKGYIYLSIKGNAYHSAFTKLIYCKSNPNKQYPNNEWLYAPTLSELIEVCGDKFGMLLRLPGSDMGFASWLAQSAYDNFTGKGSTPEEAVANLWLQLHNK